MALRKAHLNTTGLIRQRQPRRPPKLPDKLHLAAINETWRLYYIPTIASRVKIIERPASQLAISGCIDEFQLCDAVINHWLKNKSKQHLIPRLENLSQQTRLRYNNVTIKTPGLVRGLTIAEQVIAVANGTRQKIGPFDSASIYNQADGTVHIDYSSVTTITVGAFSL